MILMVTMIGLLWGLNWPAVKFLLTELPPVTLRAVAFTFAAALLAVIARARGETFLPEAREIPAILATGLFLIFGFNVLTAIGQTLTETSKAAIIAYTMPALTAGLAALLLGERLDRRRLAALAIGTAGLRPVENQVGDEDMFGNILEVTEPAVADELAAAASLVMGQAAQACPVVLARGAGLSPADEGSAALLRERSMDMFR